MKQLVSSESLVTRKDISASSKVTLEAIDGVQKQVNRLTFEADVHINQAKREHLLRSLKFPAFNERRNQVSEAHEETFEWIFVGDDGPSQEDLSGSDIEESDWEDSDLEDLDLADPSEASWDLFSNWLSSTADIYWIGGKPGSGKTTLVKYVIDHPRTMMYLNTWSPQPLIIAHFFWRPGNLMQQSIKGLLCSLLYQLLENSATATADVPQNNQTRRSGTKDEYTDWSVSELRSTFLRTLQSYERPICIFIDGLDELNPKDGPMDLIDLVEEISRCRSTKLCLSSRPEPLLEGRLSAYPHLRLQDLTRPDLQLYARDSVKFTRSIDEEDQYASFKDEQDLIELLVDKAEGVFLWIVLAIKSVNKGFTYGDTHEIIRQRIDRLPGDLTRLYKDMWARACEDNPVAYRQTAALYFRLILLGQRHENAGQDYWPSNLLQFMLASTSVADQLLDAIDNPSDLVPEKRLLQSCRAVEKRLKLYCFGLIEVVQKQRPYEETVIGWYGTQYSTLWSRYGRGELQFVHRTAKDFLLDTVDGSEILNYNSIQEGSLFLRWVRAHLAMSQLYADKRQDGMMVTNLVRPYIKLLAQFAKPRHRNGDPDWTRTVSHLQGLCNSGQLLCGPIHAARFCGGVDVFNATATICDEHLLSRSKISSFSKPAVSEILLNVCGRDDEWYWYGNERLFGNRGGPLITTLLCEGADPNWRGIAFHPWEHTPLPRFSLVRTPFTAYLAIILEQALWQTNLEWYEIVTISGNLHAFLSRSANLGDVIHRVFHYRPFTTGVLEYSTIYLAVRMPPVQGLNYLILAFSAYSVLKVLLDLLSTMIEQSRHGEEKNYEETMSLLVRCREYLNNWSKQEHSRVIGRVVAEDIVAEDSITTGWCYWSLEEDTSGIANEWMGEMEKHLLDGCLTRMPVLARDTRKGRIIDQVLKLPWTLQAKGGHEIREVLTELGILARADYETHNILGWVDKFQAKRLAEGRVVA